MRSHSAKANLSALSKSIEYRLAVSVILLVSRKVTVMRRHSLRDRSNSIGKRAELFFILSGYFNKLLNDGEISDPQYKALVKYAASVLFEDEIRAEIVEPLEKEISSLFTSELWNQLLQTKFSQKSTGSLLFSVVQGNGR